MNENDTQEEGTVGTIKQWVEDNLRLIISIIIVVAIAGGIYSYSQRSEEIEVAFEDEETQEQILIDGEDASDDINMEESDEAVTSTDTSMETTETETPKTPPVDTSKETSGSFIESAQPGEGLTHLARRALSDSLEKNPDSQLSAAHKIYIEDYLRKAVNHTGGVSIGTEVEFSKSLINQAIEQSKTLTDAQLQNLQKYVVLVPSLS